MISGFRNLYDPKTLHRIESPGDTPKSVAISLSTSAKDEFPISPPLFLP